MAYTKRYAGGFLDFPNVTTPIDSAMLNAVETALVELLSTDGSVDGQVLQWIQASSKFGPALLLNKNVDPSAAIVKSKLDFSGANGLVNADVAAAAAIARSKLDFGAGLGNADIAAAAGIVASKLVGPAFTALPAMTITQGVNVTNTTVYGKYWQFGKYVKVLARLSVTSAGTLGSIISVSGLPVAASDTSALQGVFRYFQNGVNNHAGAIESNGTTSGVRFITHGNPNNLGSTPSFAAANGDFLTIDLSYESV